MKLQSLTIIFIIIILPIVLVLSAYVGYEVKTINKQNMYNTGLQTATHDAIFAFEINTKNDAYSNNAENKRSNIKASIKTFENSLSTACNLGLYNNDKIEEYIPAIVFGLYDGFYMYAPSENQNGEYKHDLRNYVYYSEEIKKDNIDIIIRYTLDNYVAVSGTIDEKYITKAGYLINLERCENYEYTVPSAVDDKLGEATLNDNFTYQGAKILKEETLDYMIIDEDSGTVKAINNGDGIKDTTAIEYYKESVAFSEWFQEYIADSIDFINLNNSEEEYDPEYEASAFVQHKREIMKQKIEEVLNSSITAYANKTRNNYKMPKFTEEDWEKIYNNISVISLVQGMNLGFKSYNSYCILNSTNNNEYVNPNLIYFTDGNSYHDIRCEHIKDTQTTGYKIGSFEKQTYETEKFDEDGNPVTDAEGNPITEKKYYYKHNELASYDCINGNAINKGSTYDYVRNGSTSTKVKISYFTALARERYNTTKLLSSYNDVEATYFTVTYKWKDSNGTEKVESEKVKKGTVIKIKEEPSDLMLPEGNYFNGWALESTGDIYEEYTVISNVTFVPAYEIKKYTVTFETNGGTNIPQQTNIQHGKYATKPADPTMDGYTFEYWYIIDNGSNVEYNFNNPIESDITLYAKWIVNEVKVYYHDKEGNIIKTISAKVGETINVEEESILPETESNYYFIGWSKFKLNVNEDKSKDWVYFIKNNTIEVPDNDINIYPYYIMMEEKPSFKYERDSLIGNQKIMDSFTPTDVNGKLYTNKEKIIYTISNPNYSFVAVTKEGGYADSGYFETNKDEVKTANLSVNFKIKNINGEEIANETYNTEIIVDRKSPTMTNFARTETGNILKNRTVRVDVIDEDSGVKNVEYKASSSAITSLSLNRNGNTWSRNLTSNQYDKGGVTAYDNAGNARTIYWGYTDW